jgi:hypothetical protein
MDGGVVVCGQVFSPEMIERIRALIRCHPERARAQVAREVCQWLDWRSATGKPKEMSCRVALLRLHKRSLIELPPARRAVSFTAKSYSAVELPVAQALPERVEQLRGLELVVVRREQRERSQQWKKLVAEHHPLGYRPLCGAQLRYLVRCEQGLLGALAFSGATWELKVRDRWIGWSRRSREGFLHRVVSNSRFVIAHGVRVKNLASKVLALATERLPNDWQQAYGYTPVLVETYVEAQREGTAYRAANWLHIGTTRGRGHHQRTHRCQQGRKNIYVYALCKDYQARLREEPGPGQLPTWQPRAPAPGDWADQEFGAARLKDLRLHKRLLCVARAFFNKPQSNIPEACGTHAQAKAAYRLLEHEQVSMQALLQAHQQATLERVVEQQPAVVLAVQDTTSFNYTTHPDMEGLGPISTKGHKAQGVIMHDTVLYNVAGTALGVLDVQLWARNPKEAGKRATRHKRPIEQKESMKWLTSFQAAARLQRQLGARTTVVSVGDREADVYELFVLAQSQPGLPKLLVRAEQDRLLADGQGHLWEYLEQQPVSGQTVVQVPRHQGQPARTAKLEVRFAAVELRPPVRKQALGPVPIWAVYVREVEPPPAVKPLEWMLLSLVEVSTFEQAVEKVDWYRRRWKIEEYHRTLKSGCRVEDRRLGNRNSWQRCLAIDLVVAWRVEYVKTLSRQSPELPCTVAFEEDEWRALWAVDKKPLPPQPPTIREVTRRVAQHGGFLGRKADGEPGSMTLWRGFQHLSDFTLAYRAFHPVGVLRAPPRTVSSHTEYG